ncbi:MAG: GAF domain-containing protein [Bacteroidetes bacterium]|nr:MAG: GAF domain-containing protein [Bacteroidota bacterium]
MELQNYHQNVQFADEIAAGNLDAPYNAETDALGKSLLNMRDNLKKADEKDNQERFISDTSAEISEVLRQYTQDISILTDKILTRLIQKLDASQGAMYLVEKDKGDAYLEMVACFAYNRKKFLYQRIEIGQGIIGQTFLEQQPTFLTEIPAQYTPIDAGMGKVVPTCLFVVPLKANEKMVGILEIASLKMLEGYERHFLEKIADNIASTLITARNNQETQVLYQQSQIAAEELRTREEEMRQNMEELRTTQEEMQRTQAAMHESQMKSRAIFDGSINSIIIFSEQGWIEEINPATETMFGYDRNQIANMKIETTAL